MAHGHHWAIRPCQLDVFSRANKHAARWSFVPYSIIRSGVHMPPTRNRDVPASYHAADRLNTVASQPATEEGPCQVEVAIFMPPAAPPGFETIVMPLCKYGCAV